MVIFAARLEMIVFCIDKYYVRESGHNRRIIHQMMTNINYTEDILACFRQTEIFHFKTFFFAAPIVQPAGPPH